MKFAADPDVVAETIAKKRAAEPKREPLTIVSACRPFGHGCFCDRNNTVRPECALADDCALTGDGVRPPAGDGVALTSAAHPHAKGCQCCICAPELYLGDVVGVDGDEYCAKHNLRFLASKGCAACAVVAVYVDPARGEDASAVVTVQRCEPIDGPKPDFDFKITLSGNRTLTPRPGRAIKIRGYERVAGEMVERPVVERIGDSGVITRERDEPRELKIGGITVRDSRASFERWFNQIYGRPADRARVEDSPDYQRAKAGADLIGAALAWFYGTTRQKLSADDMALCQAVHDYRRAFCGIDPRTVGGVARHVDRYGEDLRQRRGEFYISAVALREPRRLLSLFAKVVVLAAESDFAFGKTHYRALSPEFEVVPDGAPAPVYRVEFDGAGEPRFVL